MGRHNQEERASKKLTREGLKEILRVNFELYKDEPDFFEYITTLVIYLMEYEFQQATGDEPWAHRPGVSLNEGLKTIPTIPTRYQVHAGHCPHCNNPVPSDRKICPYCLAMVEH